jgi:AraC family transcriptional regulator
MKHRPDRSTPADGGAAKPPRSRPIVQGTDWSISEQLCHAGPHDRPFEERHDQVVIAAVAAGCFNYRTDSGRALLYPGSFLLGNAGACFACGHEHGTGDRCVAYHYAPSLFDEIAAEVATTRRFRFAAAMLPAAQRLAMPFVAIETLESSASQIAVEEFAIQLAACVVGALSGATATRTASSPNDERRVARALHLIEEASDRPLGLAELAAVACMSKYHFLRTFRRTTGFTPYQYLLGARMRRAAAQLRASRAPVAAIAYEAGFGDLSTFNNRFRKMFGVPPGRFRKELATQIGRSPVSRRRASW